MSTPGLFPTTHWTELGDARAVERLAHAYAAPIRAWLGAALRCSADDAADLSQGFFVFAIESGFLERADRSRGRFRAFLKTALRNYVAKSREADAARKRGGRARFVPESAAPEPADPRALSPDEALDAEWKAEVVRAAIERTRAACEREGRPELFALFRDWFLEERAGAGHAEIAARHGISSGDVSNRLRRAKEIYRAQLRALVLETVGSLAELEDELAWLAAPRAPR